MTCRICYEDEGELITPCQCTGTMAFVHKECIQRWITISKRETCELCHAAFDNTQVEIPSRCYRRCTDPEIVPRALAFLLAIIYSLANWNDVYYSARTDHFYMISNIMFVITFMILWAVTISHTGKALGVTFIWFLTFTLSSCTLYLTSNTYTRPNFIYTHLLNCIVVAACIGSEYVLYIIRGV